MPERRRASDAVEEYLEAIHRFGSSAEGISTTRLAEHLQVRPASVTGMLRRLREAGLITYRRYGEIALTPAGEERAHDLIRRHRLAERLLTDLLKLPLERAHQEACRLEHALSPEVEAHLAAALGSPDSCPHGHPIDAAADDHTFALADAPEWRLLTLVRLEDESPEVVSYLAARGLLPGATLLLRTHDTVAEIVTVDVGGQTYPLSTSLARRLRVQRAPEQ